MRVLGRDSLLTRYAVLAGTDAMAKMLGLVIAKLAVDRFGADGFGVINWALSIVAYALFVGNLGLDTYAVKAATRSPESSPVLGTTLIIIVAPRSPSPSPSPLPSGRQWYYATLTVGAPLTARTPGGI